VGPWYPGGWNRIEAAALDVNVIWISGPGIMIDSRLESGLEKPLTLYTNDFIIKIGSVEQSYSYNEDKSYPLVLKAWCLCIT